MGFHAKSLQKQFAIRFAGVAVVGSAAGCMVSILLSEKVMAALLSLIGCRGNKEAVHLSGLMIPCVFMIGMFYGVAYIKARRIRKIDPTVLISK